MTVRNGKAVIVEGFAGGPLIHGFAHGALGVRFRSYTDPHLSTENELVSHVLLGVMSYFAEYEAQKISRRTIAGLERARAEGEALGRPSTFDEHRYNTVKRPLRRIGEGAGEPT